MNDDRVEVGSSLVDWVVELWRSLVDDDRIDADTQIFDLAASSLTAVRMRSRIQAELGKQIELIDILDHPTPRELAAAIETAPAWAGLRPWEQLDWSGSDAEATAPPR